MDNFIVHIKIYTVTKISKVLGMRTQNYIKTVPPYLKITAIALVAIYVDTYIDS